MDQKDLSLFFDLSLELLCIAGVDGYFRKLNPSWEDTLGYKRAFLLSKPFVEFVHPDDVESTVAAVQRLSEGNPVVGFENRYRHHDGSWRWLSWKARASEDGSIYAVASDITEQKKQAQQVLQSEERIKAFLEALPIAVYIMDANGNPYYANQLSMEILGKGIEPGYHANNLAEIYRVLTDRGEPYPEAEMPIVRALNGESSTIDDMVIQTPDADVPLEVWAKPVTDENGNVEFAIAAFLDIRERKVAEKRLRDLLRELERSNKDLDQFASIVSHDLKAPLRAITSLSEWIEEDLGDGISPDVQEKVGMLRERVRLMQDLINDLLEYARVGRRDKESETVDLNEVIAKVGKVISRPKSYQILVPEPLPTLRADPAEVFQVFANLIGNAVNYRQRDDGKVEIRFQLLEGMYEFVVEDDGPGIQPRFHEKIFEIFEKVGESKEAKGTGMGLSLVKRVIDARGGEIRVESQPGQGSKFIFTWPRIDETN